MSQSGDVVGVLTVTTEAGSRSVNVYFVRECRQCGQQFVDSVPPGEPIPTSEGTCERCEELGP